MKKSNEKRKNLIIEYQNAKRQLYSDKENLRSKKGITMIALVVTIIVLLILASITLGLLTEHGVIFQATGAKNQAELAQLKKIAQTAYTTKINRKEPTMSDIAKELEKEGYTIKEIGGRANSIIGVEVSKNPIILKEDETEEVTVELIHSEGRYFAEVSGLYYEISLVDGRIEVKDKPEKDVDNLDNEQATYTITVNTEDEGVSTASISGTEVTVQGEGEGNTILKVKVKDNTNNKEYEFDGATIIVNSEIKTYTITYDLNGGALATGKTNPLTYNATTNTFTLNNPVREGYTFKGWSGTGLTGDANLTVTIPKGSTGDRNYTANWILNELNFANKDINVTYSASAQTIENAINEATGGTGTYTYSITAGNGNNYFSLDGRNLGIKANVPSGTYTLTVRATDSGYSGSGATKDATYTITINNATITGSVKITGTNKVGETLTANVTVTPADANLTYKWYRNTSNEATGGTEIQNATNSTYTVSSDDIGKYIYVVVSASKENYTGTSWNDITDTTENGSAMAYVTITYQKGDNVSEIGKTTDEKVTGSVTLSTITAATGYIVDGWYNGNTKVGNAGAAFAPTTNVTLTAKATAATYAVTLNPSGGSVNPTSTTVTYNSTYGTLPTPTRAGYAFDGWYTAETGGDKIESSTTVTTSANNQTLYAHWKLIFYIEERDVATGDITATVEYQATSGMTWAEWVDSELSNGKYDLSNSPIGGFEIMAPTAEPQNPYEGHYYWYVCDTNGNWGANDEIIVGKTYIWKYLPCNVTYCENNPQGEGGRLLIEHPMGKQFHAWENGYNFSSTDYWNSQGSNPAFQKEGYHIESWNSEPDGSGKRMDLFCLPFCRYSNVSNFVSEDLICNCGGTYYAQWVPNPYEVTLNPGTEGTLPGKTKGQTDTTTVTYDSTYGTLPTPTRNGYAFDGWYTAETGGDKIESSTTVTITENQTLYAHWKDVSINITITGYGYESIWGSITTEITYGDGIVSGKKAGYDTNLEDAIYNIHNNPNASNATTVEVYSNGYVYAEGYDINGNLVTASLEITGIYSPTFINFTLYYRGEKMDMTSYDYQTWSEITTIFEVFRDCVLVSKKELYDAYEAAGFSDMNYMYFALQPEEGNYDWGSALCLPDWQELIEDNPETLVFFNNGFYVVSMWDKPIDLDYYHGGYYIGNIYDGQ